MVVRLAAGKTTYHVGEEIPLELEFRGTSGDEDYSFSTASYDGSGRMRMEKYEITPREGFVDPLSDLFASGNFIGGGMSSWHPLDDTHALRAHCRQGAIQCAVAQGRVSAL